MWTAVAGQFVGEGYFPPPHPISLGLEQHWQDGKKNKFIPPSSFLLLLWQGSWRTADLFSEFCSSGGSTAPDGFFVPVPWSMLNAQRPCPGQGLQRRKLWTALGSHPECRQGFETHSQIQRKSKSEWEGNQAAALSVVDGSRFTAWFTNCLQLGEIASSILPCLMWLLVLVHRLNFIPLNSSPLTENNQTEKGTIKMPSKRTEYRMHFSKQELSLILSSEEIFLFK